MARSGAVSRARALAVDAGLRRRIRDSVGAAGRLGDRLVHGVYQHRGSAQDVEALVLAWAASLRDRLVDAAERSHRVAWLDGVREAADAMVARDRRGARLSRPLDPTKRAVEFLRARARASQQNIDVLRGTYGRLATEIVLPMGKTASREVHEAVADIVRSNVSRANGQELIRQALDGVTSANPYHIETLFRTQHQLAYSAGAAAADADPDIAAIIWGYEYVTVGDDRVRPNHQVLDGVKLPKGDPRWARIRPPNGYNSILPGTMVEGVFDAASRAAYSGPVVVLRTAGGAWLAVTPDHPVLTRRGFVEAKLVRQGDELVQHGPALQRFVGRAGNRPLAFPLPADGGVDGEQVPPGIQDVFDAFAAQGVGPVGASRLAVDLDGDAKAGYSQIRVVRPDGLLRGDLAAELARKLFGEPSLVQAHPAGAGGGDAVPGAWQAYRLGRPPDLDPLPEKAFGDKGARAAVTLGQLFDRSAGQVRFDQVVGVDVRAWSGHVYDLQSPNGTIVANGLVVSNCRCQVLRVFDTDEHDVVEPGPVDFGDGPVAPEPDPGWGFNVGAVYQDLARYERRGVAAGRAAAEAARAARKLEGGFPGSLVGLVDLGSAGGSTGARIVQDAAGRRFVRKAGSSEDHLREEALALEAYRAAGIPVPETRVYSEGGRVEMLSAWVEGRPLSDLKGPELEAALAQLRGGYAVDVVLGNWDVAGLDLDNVIVRPDGVPVRIDVGGSLRFRAGGQPKPAFDGVPREFFTLYDPSVNRSGFRVFGGMTFAERVGSIDLALNRAREIAAVMPEGPLRNAVRLRLMELAEIRGVSAPMLADAFKGAYVERVARHTLEIRAAGVFEGVAEALKPDPLLPGRLFDQDGKPFDKMRGPDGMAGRAWEYLRTASGAGRGDGQDLAGQVLGYLGGQAGNSWNFEPTRMKRAWIAQRDVPEARYWNNPDAPKHTDFNERAVDALAAMQALTLQTLRLVDMPNNERARGRVWLSRTEQRSVLLHYGMEKRKPGVFARGAAESYSLFDPTKVHGDELTYQYVPHHRVLTTYLWDRGPARPGRCPLYGDDENEFVAMTEGLPAVWTSNYSDPGSRMAAPGGDWP
jgi:hypothetical protein